MFKDLYVRLTYQCSGEPGLFGQAVTPSFSPYDHTRSASYVTEKFSFFICEMEVRCVSRGYVKVMSTLPGSQEALQSGSHY
jgi:hypothetical protein